MKAGPPMLTVRNRQRARPFNTPLARRIAATLLGDLMGLDQFELGIEVVGAAEIARLNETFLRHAGATDVLCFDYLGSPEPLRDTANCLCADIVVCMDEAVAQARRYRTTWQSELVRYIVHGVLHLRGFDDHLPSRRRQMKQAEDRLLRRLARQFDLVKLARPGQLLAKPDAQAKLRRQKEF